MIEATQKPSAGNQWREGARQIVELGQYLTVMRRAMPWVEFQTMARADYGLNQSSITKVIAIAAHPILIATENLNKLPDSWALLYELKSLPDTILLEKLANGSLKRISKYEIWALRGKERPAGFGVAARNRAASRLKAEASLVDLCRKGLAMEREQPRPTGVIAKTLGISDESYRMIRKLILLKDEKSLTSTEQVSVDDALGHIDRTRNVRRYYKRLENLVAKAWGEVRPGRLINDKHSRKRIESFKNSIAILGISCDRATTIEQPNLSKEEIASSVDDLMEARKSINQLISNLRRAQNE